MKNFSQVALAFGLIPLCAQAHRTTVAQIAPPMPGNGISTLQSNLNEPKSEFNPHFYLHAGAGGMESTGGTYREDTIGLSVNLSTGAYLTRRWMLGAFYRDSFSTNGDMGLFGGSSYSSDFYGLENEVALYQGDKNEVRLGAKIGRVTVSGISTALWMPYSSMKMTTWTAGPTLSYYHFFKPKFGMGVDASYLEVLGKDAEITDSNGMRTARAQNFGVYDVGFTVQFRFQ